MAATDTADDARLQIGLQMWTVRDQMRRDALGCLADVAGSGYDAVELVGYGNSGFQAVRDQLLESKVRAVSQHVAYRRFAEDLDEVIEECTALACQYVVIQQGRHEDWTDPGAVRSFAARCNAWGRTCREAGLELGYHGYHELDNEFAPYGDGTRWDLFASETDPDVVFLQLDTYWVRSVGEDPVALLERFSGRVPTLHLKDTSPLDGGTDTTVGDGLMDLPGIVGAAARCGTAWLIVEQEGDPENALRDIRRSRSCVSRVLQGQR